MPRKSVTDFPFVCNTGHDFFQVNDGEVSVIVHSTSSRNTPKKLSPPRFICRKCGQEIRLESLR